MKPGWYNDPQDPRHERYFNGYQWTATVRADIPDIPLAPWVDPAHPDYAYGHIVDTSAPTRSVRTWATAFAGVALIGLALGYGVVTTNDSKARQEVAGGDFGITIVEPPAGSGPAVVPSVTCADLQDVFLSTPAGETNFGVVGFNGAPTVIADFQPITSLPSGDTYYMVLRCGNVAKLTDGTAVQFPLGLAVDSSGLLTTLVG